MGEDLDERGLRDTLWLQRVSRRRFLSVITAAGAGLLAACAGAEVAREPTPYRTVTPYRALESPPPPGEQTPEAVAAGELGLEEFLQFSSLLTGVDNLDPVLGRVYLQALQSGGSSGPSLASAYGAASSGSGPLPQDIEALTGAGFFDQEGMGNLADQIITVWYTGIYTVDGEERVATYVDALAWKVLHFTKPPTLCAEYGFWSEEPLMAISPSFQFTPVPTQPSGSGANNGS